MAAILDRMDYESAVIINQLGLASMDIGHRESIIQKLMYLRMDIDKYFFRLSQKPCIFDKQGRCRYGKFCYYLHSDHNNSTTSHPSTIIAPTASHAPEAASTSTIPPTSTPSQSPKQPHTPTRLQPNSEPIRRLPYWTRQQLKQFQLKQQHNQNHRNDKNVSLNNHRNSNVLHNHHRC